MIIHSNNSAAATTRPIDAPALLPFLAFLAMMIAFAPAADVAVTTTTVAPRDVAAGLIPRRRRTAHRRRRRRRGSGGARSRDRTDSGRPDNGTTTGAYSSSHRSGRLHRQNREERPPQTTTLSLFRANVRSSRRVLQKVETPNVMDDETKLRHAKNFIGGLYPPVDKDMLPMYLRDSLDAGTESSRPLDLVYFWHVPKASGSTMKNIMNYCFGLRRAERLEDEASMEYARDNILNMDTSSPEGLSFSFANQIVNSGKVDVIVSNYFLSGAALFTDLHYGRTFVILRHPVDVALSLFHYRKKATWERSYRKEWNMISFHEYVQSSDYIDNWMVRQLTGTMPWVRLTEAHFERAKQMMSRKIFVGVMEEMDESVRQLKAFFEWSEKTPGCAYDYIHTKPTNANDHPPLQGGRGGKTWHVVIEKEKWDMSLYYYGLEMFAAQRKWYSP